MRSCQKQYPIPTPAHGMGSFFQHLDKYLYRLRHFLDSHSGDEGIVEAQSNMPSKHMLPKKRKKCFHNLVFAL